MDIDDYATRIVKEELVTEAKKQLKKKKSLPALSKVYFKEFLEGKAAQIMHIGPFSEEGVTIEKLHDFIRNKGL